MYEYLRSTSSNKYDQFLTAISGQMRLGIGFCFLKTGLLIRLADPYFR